MSVELSGGSKPRSRAARINDFMFRLFLRCLAVIFFAAAIFTWLCAIGYWEGTNYRFDTMGLALKIYTAVMAVMLPVACVGLWTTLSWGRVIWFFAVAFQSVSLIRFPDLFQYPGLVLLFHLSCLAIYVIFQLLEVFIAKKE
ncbi:MAG: hypothetical protein GKR97_07220 [Rhizobiaceae bacterium]|nr:hypothetical protein [Rhizobiaceae bacterium]